MIVRFGWVIDFGVGFSAKKKPLVKFRPWKCSGERCSQETFAFTTARNLKTHLSPPEPGQELAPDLANVSQAVAKASQGLIPPPFSIRAMF